MVGLVGALPAGAQLRELFSRHVRVYRPRGEFTPLLIRLQPGGGEGWKAVAAARPALRLQAPAGARVDAAPKETRVLEITFAESSAPPQPVLRVDAFPAQAGEPTVVDDDYVEAYAEEYPKSIGGRFEVTDSGRVVLNKKLTFAMVGGTYQKGAVRLYRLQWAHPGKDRHLFFTFDCAEHDRERYAEPLGRTLLSVELP
jgi:hypothetical protein